MKQLLDWWVLVGVVAALDVALLVLRPFPPAIRWSAVAILTGILVLFALLRLIEARQMREQRRAAFAHLDAVRQARRGEGPKQ
jgi:uncharacterized membrane protein (DUF106 family)